MSAAADEAGDQGFVTELAGPTDVFSNAVWSERDQELWESLQSEPNPDELFKTSLRYDDLLRAWESAREHVMLASGS